MGCCWGQPERVWPPEGDRQPPVDHPRDFKGPVENRTCRDVIFLIIFAAFLGALGYGYYYAVVRGDVERVIYGSDSYGDVCGRKNPAIVNITKSGKDLTGKPYLVFYYNDTSALTTPFQDELAFLNGWTKLRQCDTKCPNQLESFLRRCLPVNSSQAATSFLKSTGLADFFEQVSLDVQLCWKEILYLCLIALGFSIVLTILFRFLAGFVVWVLLAALVLGSIAGTAYLWVTWYLMREKLKAMTAPSAQAEKEVTNMMIYAIVLSVVTVLILLTVLVMRKRIALVVALFREAGKVVHSMPLLLFQPLWTFVSIGLIFAGWIWGVLWIESAGNATRDVNGYVIFTKDTVLQVLRWYNLFALLWTTQFCLACQHLVIAGAVTTWFFSRDKSKLGFPILTSLGRLIRYHLGSVALGSFIIALMKLIRLILSFIERRLKRNGAEASVLSCFIKCCQCCLACFERFLKFLNTNAYIEIAIYGKNFCSSAQRAFGVLANNALRVAAINSVGDFVLFLGKAGVVAAIVFIGIEFIKDKAGIHHLWVPVLIAAIFAYIIAHCFISVYEMCIDTIFLCFCEDCDINDGIERPYFMSKGLMEFVENSRKAMAVLDERNWARRQEPHPANNYRPPEGPAVWTTSVPPPPHDYYYGKATAPPAS